MKFPDGASLVAKVSENMKQGDVNKFKFGLAGFSVVQKIELTHKTSWGKVPLISKHSDANGSYSGSKPSCPLGHNLYTSIAIGIDPMTGKLRV